MLEIRPETRQDIAPIHHVVASAFGSPLEANAIDTLRERGKLILSVVAELDGLVTGHICFTDTTLEINPRAVKTVGLAPLAVHPDHQREGIGSGLIWASLDYLCELGYEAVFVVGSPRYYPRCGFVPAAQFNLHCTYDFPPEHFMAQELAAGALDGCRGWVRYQSEWDGV